MACGVLAPLKPVANNRGANNYIHQCV